MSKDKNKKVEQLFLEYGEREITERLRDAQQKLIESYFTDDVRCFVGSLNPKHKNTRPVAVDTFEEFHRRFIDPYWANRINRSKTRPPFNAEYLLYLLLRKEEREFVIGDLIEGYDQVFQRFDKRHADIWFYKQVAGSIVPLLRLTLLRIGALVWLGRILRRLIS